MDTGASQLEQAFVQELRRLRAELRESMSALELALAAPATVGRSRWAERAHVAVIELSADLGEHVAITEGPDGLYGEVLETAPRLAGAVTRLTGEHAVIREQVDDLLGYLTPAEDFHVVDGARDRGTALLGSLVRHRQSGSDLVFEAYEMDIGGET